MGRPVSKKVSIFFYLVLWLFFMTFSCKKSPKNLIFKDIHGGLVSLADAEARRTLFLFLNQWNIQTKSLVMYSQVLLNKFGVDGLRVACVVCGEKEKVSNFIQKAKIFYPVIEDCRNEIKKKFGLCNACGGIVLLDAKNEAVFKNNALLDKETLRQLIESEITGTVNYKFQAIPNQTFQLHQEFPDIRFYNPFTGEETELSLFKENKIIITFFSSFCSACKSGKRIETLKKATELIRQGTYHYRIIVAFTEPTEMEDISRWETQIKIPFDKFISSDVFSDNEKYVTFDNYKTDPLTVMLNKERKVVFLEKTGESEESIMENLIERLRD